MARPLTILHVCSSQAVDRWTEGSLRLARSLQLRGHRVLFSCRKDTPHEEKAKSLNLQVFTDMRFPAGFPRKELWRECRLMARRIDIEILDVVHAHGGPEAWIASVGSRLATRNPATVRTVSKAAPKGQNPFARLAHQGLIDHIIVASGTVFDQIRGLEDYDHRYASLIFNGVNLKRFNPSVDGRKVRQEFSIADDAPLAVWAGRIGQGKGEDVFLKAMAKVIGDVANARALMACDTDDDEAKEGLLNQARELGLGEVVAFTGRRDDIEGILSAADVVAVPPAKPQHTSRLMLEAAALGRPAVASSVSGVKEFVQDGVTGALSKPDDPDGLASALRALLSDRQEAQKRGLAGRLFAEQELGEDRKAELVEDLYFRILEAQGGADGYSY